MNNMRWALGLVSAAASLVLIIAFYGTVASNLSCLVYVPKVRDDSEQHAMGSRGPGPDGCNITITHRLRSVFSLAQWHLTLAALSLCRRFEMNSMRWAQLGLVAALMCVENCPKS
jgi:hypothetical protein